MIKIRDFDITKCCCNVLDTIEQVLEHPIMSYEEKLDQIDRIVSSYFDTKEKGVS